MLAYCDKRLAESFDAIKPKMHRSSILNTHIQRAYMPEIFQCYGVCLAAQFQGAGYDNTGKQSEREKCR